MRNISYKYNIYRSISKFLNSSNAVYDVYILKHKAQKFSVHTVVILGENDAANVNSFLV